MLQLPQLAESELQAAVWDLLEDERKVSLQQLPHTGLSPEKEQLLSSTFIQSADYGTRCSNFLRMTPLEWIWLEKAQQGEQHGMIRQQQITLQ